MELRRGYIFFGNLRTKFVYFDLISVKCWNLVVFLFIKLRMNTVKQTFFMFTSYFVEDLVIYLILKIWLKLSLHSVTCQATYTERGCN